MAAEILPVLQRIPFLRGVPQEVLQSIAESLPQEEIEPGASIVRQGQPAAALIILLRGSAVMKRYSQDGSFHSVGELHPGDVFGEMEIVNQSAYRSALEALESCTVLFWEARALRVMAKDHPTVVAGLRFAAESRRLAHSRAFPWLAEGESIRAIARKDINILFQGLSLPVMVLIAGIAFLWWGIAGGSGVLAGVGGLLAAAGLGYALWKRIDWGNDYYIVTDRRAVWLEKVVGLYDSQQEAPLHMVLSVSVNTELLGRSLGYGDVIIRTYTGQLTFRDVHDPHSMAAVIDESWRRIRQAQDQEDHAIVVDALRKRLGGAVAQEEPLPQEADATAEPARPAENIGLDHWTFQVRFEEGGVITYRKHWAVLLRAIALPSALVLLVVGMLGASLGGLLQLLSGATLLWVALLALVPSLGWWVYRYVDWANDIYQVTADHIVDVYKKPLGREVRKVAPLENILSTNVQRKGLIGLLLNYGDVVAEVGTAQFNFEGVYQPNLVQQDLVRAQEALLQARREIDRRQRRQELVEWFGAYHQEASAAEEHNSEGEG